MSKQLTPEENTRLMQNMQKFQDKVHNIFSKDALDKVECEYKYCPCTERCKMAINEFNVMVTPAPELDVIFCCRNAILHIGEATGNESVFHPKLN